MDSKALIRWKMTILYGTISKMSTANSKVKDFESSLQKLKTVYGKNITINDAPAYENLLTNSVTAAKEASSSVTGRIVPSLNYSIYLLQQELNKGE